MPNNAKQNLYQFVDWLRWSWGFPYGEPINARQICNDLADVDVVCHRFDTPGFCGAAFAGNPKNTIVLNAARTEKEQNFDSGHELIHLTRHRNKGDGIFQCFVSEQKSFIEWEANEGSAQCIVPYQDFIPRFVDCLGKHPSFVIPDLLAEHYNVSAQVINIRLDSLGYEIDQYRNGVEIGHIRLLSRSQCKREGIVPTSYSAYCAYADVLDGVDTAM